MKYSIRLLNTIVLGLSLELAVMSAAARGQQTNDPPSTMPPVLWTSSDGEWIDIPLLPPGAKLKVVDGIPGASASDMFLKFPQGYAAPWHWYTTKETIYIQAGTMEVTMQSTGNKRILPPGSVFIAFPRQAHKATCIGTGDCLFFMNSMGPLELHLVDDEGRNLSPNASRAQAVR
jgi:quercetin dioxygenase-like cupin family protein